MLTIFETIRVVKFVSQFIGILAVANIGTIGIVVSLIRTQI